MKKLAIGNDHAAFEAKRALIAVLTEKGYSVEDKGCFSEQSCDYPDFAASVCKDVATGTVEQGILLCGSGVGMSIAANKFPGIRAALCGTEEIARLSRQHNDANVLCLPARFLSSEEISAIALTWLQVSFSDEDRHKKRIAKIMQLER